MKPFTMALVAISCLACNTPGNDGTVTADSPEADSSKSIIAYYDNVWALRDTTIFYFYGADGTEVSVLRAPGTQGENAPQVPDKMLELEGLQQIPNPEFVGEPFKIQYGSEGQVTKVERSQEVNAPSKLLAAAYTKASVHPDYTEYSFLIDLATKSWFESVQVNSDDADTSVEMPRRMLADPPLVSPVGAHPLLIDDTYLLYFNEEGEVYRVKSPTASNYKLVEYESAAVYPDHTKFVFYIEDQGFFVNVMHEAPSVEMPDNLLVDEESEEEALPGANPDLVGKIFKVYYDAENNAVFKIEAT